MRIKLLLAMLLLSGPVLADFPISSGTNDNSAVRIDGVGYLNASEFGAVGDGVTDDQPALQKAIDVAVEKQIPLVLNTGTYLLNSSYSSGAFLSIYKAYGITDDTFQLIGVGDVELLVTNELAGTIISVAGGWSDFEMKNISINNQCEYSIETKVCIGFQGGGANAIVDGVVDGCTFDGYSRGISLTGTQRFTIKNSTFLNSRGRDGGTGVNTEPNVGIWAFWNSTAKAIDTRIVNNYYTGYSGTGGITNDAPVTATVGDGFVYGDSDGWFVSGNIVEGFGYEGIYVNAPSIYSDDFTGGKCFVEGNSIIANYPDETQSITSTNIHTASWGVRCDYPGSVVSDNMISDIRNGVLSSLNSGDGGGSVIIKNNSIIHNTGDRGNGYGISLNIASPADTHTNSIISGNVISHDFGVDFDESSTSTGSDAILVARAVGTKVINNRVIISNWDDDDYPMRGVGVLYAPDTYIGENTFAGINALFRRQGALDGNNTTVELSHNTFPEMITLQDTTISSESSTHKWFPNSATGNGSLDFTANYYQPDLIPAAYCLGVITNAATTNAVIVFDGSSANTNYWDGADCIITDSTNAYEIASYGVTSTSNELGIGEPSGSLYVSVYYLDTFSGAPNSSNVNTLFGISPFENIYSSGGSYYEIFMAAYSSGIHIGGKVCGLINAYGYADGSGTFIDTSGASSRVLAFHTSFPSEGQRRLVLSALSSASNTPIALKGFVMTRRPTDLYLDLPTSREVW